jgi:hypothetical protein
VIDNRTLQFLAFKRSTSGVITEYTAPQSSSTWLYGRGGIDVDAGYYQDKVNPERVHRLLLQDGR